ncbi:hypothetical protein Tco_1185160 [Tanacetum coccineum]
MSKHRVVDVHYADHISAYTRSGNALKEDRYDVYDRFDRMSERKGSGLREHLERRVEDGSFFKGKKYNVPKIRIEAKNQEKGTLEVVTRHTNPKTPIRPILGDELIKEPSKKQKVDDNTNTIELKQLMKIIPDEEEVAIDAISLAVKSPKIVGWKIYKEGRKSYYQIMRADGKSQMYMFFSQMLKSFDREDLEDLYKLVKAKYESTRPVEWRA